MITLKTINKELKKQGINAELVKGEGYFYFWGPDVDVCFEQGVYVYNINDLSLEEWIEEARAKMF